MEKVYRSSSNSGGRRYAHTHVDDQVTAGKIYLEIERARLVKKLASMKESEGGVSEAAEIMMEVAVETFGAMARTEKIFFILEQIRLLLENKDYVRAQIYCKKINPRSFSG